MAQITSREDIAANVRALVARQRVEQLEISSVIGKGRTATWARLTGATSFRIEELQAIAVHLNVPLEQLLEPAESLADTGT